MEVKVFDRTLKQTRVVQEKAYKILHKRYQLVSYVDSEGNEIDGPAPVVVTQKKSQAKSVDPVEVKPQITVLKQIKTPEEINAKKAELEALNQQAIQKKPGPKPKINA